MPGNDRNRNGGVTVHADLNRARSPRRVKSQLAAEHLVVGDHELDRLTLWIAAASSLTMIVMFALERNWGEARDSLFVAADSLAITAIPETLPTVTQTTLSRQHQSRETGRHPW